MLPKRAVSTEEVCILPLLSVSPDAIVDMFPAGYKSGLVIGEPICLHGVILPGLYRSDLGEALPFSPSFDYIFSGLYRFIDHPPVQQSVRPCSSTRNEMN